MARSDWLWASTFEQLLLLATNNEWEQFTSQLAGLASLGDFSAGLNKLIQDWLSAIFLGIAYLDKEEFEFFLLSIIKTIGDKIAADEKL